MSEMNVDFLVMNIHRDAYIQVTKYGRNNLGNFEIEGTIQKGAICYVCVQGQIDNNYRKASLVKIRVYEPHVKVINQSSKAYFI